MFITPCGASWIIENLFLKIHLLSIFSPLEVRESFKTWLSWADNYGGGIISSNSKIEVGWYRGHWFSSSWGLVQRSIVESIFCGNKLFIYNQCLWNSTLKKMLSLHYNHIYLMFNHKTLVLGTNRSCRSCYEQKKFSYSGTRPKTISAS